MADRTVVLRIGANVSGLQSQLRLAQNSVNEFSKKSVSYIEKNSASIDSLSNSVGVVGAGLVGLAATAVTRFAQFDKAMSAVAATGDDARGSLEALRSKAIEAGADTAFSAAEAANAIEELAKAGVTSEEILGGGLAGALSLAAAGEIDVAQAAETAASAMTQFNLKGADVGHIADLLAAGAGKAQGGVLDMGQALNQSGLIAAQVGLSIEETTGALAAMASAGLTGSDAGTSLKTSLIALSSPSAVAAKEMERLGLSAYDANGEFIGMEALAGQLQARLGGLTDEQRNSALATIFGTDALRTANVLYSEGADGIREWTNAVDDQGFAAETAAARTDNLIGDLERLGGSLDSVFIQSGSGANNALRGIVQGAEDVVDAVGRIPAPVLTATTLIAGTGGLALLGVAGLGKLTVGFVEARDAAKSLGVSTKAAGVAAGLAGVALAAGTIAISAWAQSAADARAAVDGWKATLDEFGNTTDATLESINTTLSESRDVWYQIGEDQRSATEVAEQYGVSIVDVQQAILGQDDAFRRVRESLGAANEQYAYGSEAAGLFRIGSEHLLGTIAEQRDQIAQATTETERKAAADEAAGVATGDLAAATEDTTSATESLTVALEENWQAQLDASGAVLSLRDAQNQAEAAYDDARQALQDNGKTLDVTTEKGRANRAALDQIAAAGYDVVNSMRENGASQGALQKTMGTTRKRFIDVATSMGLGEKAAGRLADELGLIPKNVEPKVKVIDNASGTIQKIRSDIESLRDRNITITTYRREASERAQIDDNRNRPGFAGGGFTGHGAKYQPAGVVHKGEWVLRQESTKSIEAAAPGLLGAMNASGAAALGLAGYAVGGEVGAANRQVASAQRELERARAQARRARDAARAAARTDRESDDRNADRLERAAEKRLNRAERMLDDARGRRDRLRQERAEVGTSLRRGEIRDSVTGGLSGAIGVTDQLRDLANSGDVGDWRAGRLRGVAGEAEKALTSLYKQADRIDAKIASAVERFEMLKQVQSQVQSGLVGGFGLDQVQGAINPWTGQEGPVTGQALVAAAEQYRGKVKKFSGLLKRLQEAGAGGAILQEVAGYGVEQGIPIAEALLSLPKGELKGLAQTYEDIATFAGHAGASVARAVGGAQGGLWEAEQAVKAAEAQADAIDKRIGSWAKILGNELAHALGIKPRASGGTVAAGAGYLVGERGPELFVPPQPGYVMNASATAASLSAGPQKIVNVYVTQNYPQTIAPSKALNKALQHAAEEFVG